MKTYKELKTKFLEWKKEIVLGVCFVLVFIMGFGTGRFERGTTVKAARLQPQYTTKTKATPTNKEGEAPTEPFKKEPVAKTPTVGDANCIVKGNVSSNGKKIYHVQGGASYKIVKPEQCFTTPAEAEAAGFVKSSR